MARAWRSGKQRIGEAAVAVCIRCGQPLTTRTACSYCRDLTVRVFDENDGGRRIWVFELWRVGDVRAPPCELIATMGGFVSFAEANARGHELLRRCADVRGKGH
jgi:hypothetical protein